MNPIPDRYSFLLSEPWPRMLLEALRLYGIQETQGPRNTPEIMAWAKELKITYLSDSVPWCGLFMAIVARRAGKPTPKIPLWARAWADWGLTSDVPMLGDVLVFCRGSGGHVGLYVAEDGECYHVLGGNQGDAVSIVRIARPRLIAARRFYKAEIPANVRVIVLSGDGKVSVNEA